VGGTRRVKPLGESAIKLAHSQDQTEKARGTFVPRAFFPVC
jgi:hypothetical protein